MKTTKTIEITICDVCGNEKRHQDWPCSRCHKDMCDGCEEHFSVDIQRVGKEKYAPSGQVSFSQHQVYRDYPPRMCKECAVVIIDGLKALGLVSQGTKSNQVREERIAQAEADKRWDSFQPGDMKG